jgi:hypothetical protein
VRGSAEPALILVSVHPGNTSTTSIGQIGVPTLEVWSTSGSVGPRS